MQLELGASSISKQPTPPEPNYGPSRTKRVTIALLLGLLCPGLGQVYDRKPWRGLAMALSLSAVLWVPGELRLLLSFSGLIGSLLLSLFWRLWITGDGVYLAWKNREMSASTRGPWVKSAAATAMILLLEIYPAPNFLLKHWGYFRAFKIPSASMCPTICEGDRVVANMDTFIKSGPHRGDVILMKHESMDALLIKRIIGVEGDTISTRDGQILVNGQRLASPNPAKGCGNSRLSSSTKEELPFFNAVKVPASSFFVVGDNLPNSYDSRIEGFGFVTSRQVRGRPLFIYWSSDHSRISCKIQ